MSDPQSPLYSAIYQMQIQRKLGDTMIDTDYISRSRLISSKQTVISERMKMNIWIFSSFLMAIFLFRTMYYPSASTGVVNTSILAAVIFLIINTTQNLGSVNMFFIFLFIKASLLLYITQYILFS